MLVRLYIIVCATDKRSARLILRASQKIDDKIREMIKQQADNTTDERPGMITEKSA